MSRRSFDSRFLAGRVAAPSLVAAAVAAALAASYPGSALAQEADASLQEVTVTGSRIVRRDLASSSPVVTVENQAFEKSSTIAVESVLNQLPQFVPANTQFNTADVFPSATTTPGISTVSLRGLGTNRTLVLVDGHRFQPANSTLVIDTNSIPSAALESVEIITGGASAVYGADALAGVTNFKLKSKFEGIDLQMRQSLTERGDGQESRVSMLLGSSLAEGRGNAMIGLEYYKRGEVLALDRPFFSDALKDSKTTSTSAGRMNAFQYEIGTNGQPSQAASNALFPERPAAYNVPRNTSFLFNGDGTVYKQELQGLGFNGDIVNDPRYKIGPNGQLIENNFDLRYSSPADRYSIFGKADFKINDYLTAFATVNFVNTSNTQVLQPSGATGGFGATIPYGSEKYGASLALDGVTTRPEYVAGGAYGLNCPATGGCTQSQAFPVTPELAALLNSRGANATSNTTTAVTYDPTTGVPNVISGTDASWTLGGTLNFLPARSIENTTNLYQILAGFRGELGIADWTWEAYASHGATRTDLDYIGFASTRRFQVVAQSPNFGKGLNGTSIASTSISCTSGLPIFSNFQVSQDCIDAIAADYTDRTRIEQNIYEATAQGRIIDLPMGQVRGALGLTYRKDDFAYLPDASREVNSVIDVPVGAFGQANVRGKTTVKEAYGELLVPLLKDVFLAKNLELELGYRYSDYDITGSVPTYKALFSWEPIDHVRFRGGYQLANRAPNINELFLEASSQAVTMRSAEYCRSDTTEATGNKSTNPDRAKVQALCAAIIGNNTSEFSLDPNNYVGGRGDGVILQQSSGNRDLKSEEGKTYTLGVVLTSPFEHPALSGTSLSLDYYKVRIAEAISTVTAQVSYDLCFNKDHVSNPNYLFNDPNGICQNIIRDARTGAALQVNSQYQNLGLIKTNGLDANLAWRAALEDIGLSSLPGNLSANLSYTKLFSYKAQEFPTAPLLENAGTLARLGLFDWRSVMTVRYTLPTWGAGLNWRHLPSVKNSAYVTDPTTTIQGAGAYDVADLNADWTLTENFAISGGVDNVFDRQPERVGAGQVTTIAPGSGGGTTVSDGAASTSAGYYDVLGRRYYINLKLTF
ncbi:MAG: TonB-dependent receptor [Gammaproteobacteria bacterium]